MHSKAKSKIPGRYPPNLRHETGRALRSEDFERSDHEDIDLMGELRKYLKKPKSDPLSKWDDLDQDRFKAATDKCFRATAGSLKYPIMTPAMTTKKTITEFASTAKSVLIIIEEAAMAR